MQRKETATPGEPAACPRVVEKRVTGGTIISCEGTRHLPASLDNTRLKDPTEKNGNY
jgi:hypothetical protein